MATCLKATRLLRSATLLACLLVPHVGILPSFAQKEDRTKQSSSRRAIAYYADAASFQNNGAYELAIEQWNRLLKEFPNDPLASKAWHYLGVCWIQLEKPDYQKGSQAFKRALQDKNLQVREESLINLSWCMFTQARTAAPGSTEQKRGLSEAKATLSEFLRSYSDGSYTDQALFYLGEIEYLLGNTKQSIAYYNRMLSSKTFAKSSLRPEARYAVAVAYEEQKQLSQAKQQYGQMLKEHSDHRLAGEASLRLADILLTEGNTEEAEKRLREIIASNSAAELADYAMLRLGYALTLEDKQSEAQQYYEQLLTDYPESKHTATAAFSLGQLLYKQGQYDAAADKLRQATKGQDAQAAEAAHWLALTLLKEGKAKEAESFLINALKWSKTFRSHTALQMDYADALYAQPEKLTEARKAYEALASASPEDALAPRAAYNAAFAALQQGELADARKWSEAFLERYPQDPLRNDVAYVAAEALLQQGEHKAAVKAYSSLRQADPSNVQAAMWTLRLAMAHYLAGEYEPASKLLTANMSKFTAAPEKAEAQFILGASYLYLDRPSDAIKQLSSSHGTDDSWSSADEVLLLLSEAQQRTGDEAAAKQSLELLLKKYPKSRLKTQVEYKLAQLAAALNDLDDAISRYRAIVRSDSSENYYDFATYGIAWCLMQQKQYQPALESLTPLLNKGMNSGITREAKLAEGVCLRNLGRADQAIGSLQTFLATDPTGTSLGNALYEAGLAYMELGKIEEATQLFERILEEVPQYPAVDKVLYEIAWNYEESSDSQKASRYFERLVQQYPRSEFAAEATYMLGQSKYAEDKFTEAAALYQQVVAQQDVPAELAEKAVYKLGWSYFQREQFRQAAEQFARQAQQFPTGPLAVDALFMNAECDFNEENYRQALSGYLQARELLESTNKSAASQQVRTLIYLHAAQCYRETEQWKKSEDWLRVILDRYPDSTYAATVQYELGYALQKQNKPAEALEAYAKAASYRNEVGARARFMMGEVYFAQRDFTKAIPEFQKVMFGFNGEKAPEEIKNWQAKAAYEAARCFEVLIEDLRGENRKKIIDEAEEFYQFIVEKHGSHELAAQANNRLGELKKLR